MAKENYLCVCCIGRTREERYWAHARTKAGIWRPADMAKENYLCVCCMGRAREREQEFTSEK